MNNLDFLYKLSGELMMLINIYETEIAKLAKDDIKYSVKILELQEQLDDAKKVIRNINRMINKHYGG